MAGFQGVGARWPHTSFTQVIASDPGREQLAHAAARAEQPPAEVTGADLVTAAQALHWFDLERFYPVLERVLRPGGLFAAWGYGLMRITPQVDAVVTRYYTDVVGSCWPPDRRHIRSGYRSPPFPFMELVAPNSR